MDEKPIKRERGGAAMVMVFVAVLLVLPMLYTLSIGPVVLMLESGQLDRSWERAVIAFYYPISIGGKCIPGFQSVLNDYVNWWTSWVTPPPRSFVP